MTRETEHICGIQGLRSLGKKKTKFLYKVFFFIQIKNRLNRRIFGDIEEVQAELRVVVKSTAIREVQRCLQQSMKSQKGIF